MSVRLSLGGLLVAGALSLSCAAVVSFDRYDESGSAGIRAELHVVQLAAGAKHTCVLVDTGRVRCWGDNEMGQLGLGPQSADGLVPVEVPGVVDAIAIGVGRAHSCAVVANGEVLCWGANEYGQLGSDYSFKPGMAPVRVPGVTGATMVAAGTLGTCAIVAGGGVVCWGGWPPKSHRPSPIAGLTGAQSISTRCAVLQGGTVQCWRADGTLQPPVPAAEVSSATAIGVGSDDSCVVVASGAVKCWEEVCVADTNAPNVRVRPVNGFAKALLVDSGKSALTYKETYHSCATLSSTTAWCWFPGAQPWRVEGLAPSIQVAVGGAHTCSLRTNRTEVECWGANERGQLGFGTSTYILTPVLVAHLLE